MSDENIIYNCEYVKSVSDEYLHGELSEDDKKAIDSHLLECNECTVFYNDEKNLLDIIKSSEYIPDVSFKNLVMDKIIDEKIVIQKRSGKRPAPFGLISAAVIILIVFLANPNMFDRVDNASAQLNESADMRIYGGFDDEDSDDLSYYSDSLQPRAAGNEISAYESDTAYDMGIVMEMGVSGEPMPVPEAMPAPAVAALEIPVIEESEEGEYRDIPIPTGPFSEHRVALIICVNVDTSTRERLTKELLEKISTAKTDEHDINIIYINKEYQQSATDILDINSVHYEFRYGDSNAEDIAVLFY